MVDKKEPWNVCLLKVLSVLLPLDGPATICYQVLIRFIFLKLVFFPVKSQIPPIYFSLVQNMCVCVFVYTQTYAYMHVHKTSYTGLKTYILLMHLIHHIVFFLTKSY